MDAHTLIQQSHHIVSLASLACVFSGIHTIQYSLLDHDMDDIEDHNLQENDSTSHSGFTSTPDTSNPANTSSNSGKASGHWTDQEITLLLDHVEAHCSLNTLRGLNLKKTQFNKAHDTVKAKDSKLSVLRWGCGLQKSILAAFAETGCRQLMKLRRCYFYLCSQHLPKLGVSNW